MTEFKHPLLEVIQAVQEIQASRGPTKSQVCDFVRRHSKNYEHPNKVLKTIKTLKKLVEEGILVKKGKRYMFSTAPKCPPEKEEEDEEECEEEGEDDECDEKKEEDENDCDENEEEKPEEEEENEEDCDEEEGEKNEDQGPISPCCNNEDDDDDDDDDDDEDDDDDDDDDDDCKQQKEENVEKDPCKDHLDELQREENRSLQCMSTEKMILNDGRENQKTCGSEGKKNERKTLNAAVDGREKGTAREASEGTVIKTSAEGRSRGGENIAFCARDFIDSLNRPKSTSKVGEKTENLEVMLQYKDVSENDEMGKILQDRKRKFYKKRSKRNKYRSRSPIKKIKANSYILKRDRSEDIGTCSSQYFHEPMDADLEVPSDNNKEIEIEYETVRHRSPFSLLSSTHSRGAVERQKSSFKDHKEMSTCFTENDDCMKKKITQNKVVLEGKNKIQTSNHILDQEEADENLNEGISEEFPHERKNINDDEVSLCTNSEKSNLE